MKIGIDISQSAYPGTGVATYTNNLIENLLSIDKSNEYVFFYSSLRCSYRGSLPNVKEFKFPPTMLNFLWNKIHIVPIEWLIGKTDIFHSSDYLQPPTNAPKVSTIHDLTVYKYPQTQHPKIIDAIIRSNKWIKKEAKSVIAVSEATKKDIIEILNIPAEKIEVIHEAAGKQFNERVQNEKEKIKQVKEKYGIGETEYILSVGTQEPRKNIARLIKAYQLLSNEVSFGNSSLVIVGKFGWGEKIAPVKGIILTGYVSDEDLPYLYAGARLFVYPSLYEGFGLPILEAMGCGCPVVSSDTSSLPEVGGKAVVYINPENVENIAKGILEAIKPASRKILIEAGFIQAQKFSWEKCAQETLKVYERTAITNK